MAETLAISASSARPLAAKISRADFWWLGIGGLLVLIAVAATHWPALDSKAICFDDNQYVMFNTLVWNPSWNSVGRFFGEVSQPSTVLGYYQPLTMVSLMLDASMATAPGDYAPFRRTNFLLHLLNVGLVIFLFYSLLGQPIPALLIGLLYGVHPLTVESVVWINQRKTLLAAFFALASLSLYVWYARSRDVRLIVGAGVAYLLAMFAKPTAIPVCLIFLVLDWWPLGRLNKQCLVEKLPFIAMAAIFAVITIISQGRTAGVGFQGGNVPITTLFLVCHNIIFYLVKWVWPVNLTAMYPIPNPFDLSNPMLLWGLLGTLALVPLLILSVKKKTPAITAGFLFYFLGLLPTLQFLGFATVVSADRFAYLPLVGIWLIVCWALCVLWTRTAPPRSSGPMIRVGVAIVLVFVAFCEAAAARDYLPVWKDTITLRRYMLAHNERSALLMDLVATDLLFAGNADQAFELETKALEANPEFHIAHFNMANMLLDRKRIDEALAHYQEAARLREDYGMAHSMIGRVYAMQGRLDDAISESRKGIELQPKIAELHYNLATLLAQRGKVQEALQEFVQAIFLRPNYPEAHNNLGSLLASTGKFDMAAKNFEEAIRQSPDYYQAHANLARAYDRLARRADALREYQECIRLNAQDEDARRAVNAINRMIGAAEAEIRRDYNKQLPAASQP